MISTTVSFNFAIVVPIVAALIAAVLGPLLLNSHKERSEAQKERLEATGELSVRIIDEGRDMRKELRDRVDSLEKRLQDATIAFNAALDENRKLRSDVERCEDLIKNLRREIEETRVRDKKEMGDRITHLENPEGVT